ncbi:hypothetical protein CXB49_11875 [Chromobacterium sp. ATCC 53434]|uniref:EAL domain-containing protein n=1 Tax=Chromobacterium sp. (strain ATCC 53434 / SC 14030) TaxID=2059672 RepID=UPI000C755AC4|nr:EAL domain-containing protein [Chromobacterium sp. ATCC 53434]AUH51466.1 hypothetical protein CXB49_11875 [Chromobacterium sp. ATCC 53434]
MHDHSFETPSREGLAAALRNREFRMHYQPQLCCRTSRISGAEALMRWARPGRPGLEGPAGFIPQAEESGFIVELGDWGMESAVRALASWRVPGFTVAVNLSGRQITDSLPGKTERLLRRADVDPSALELEITESYLFHDLPTMVGVVRELRAIGVRVAIDDFGTGFSVLEHLRHLPATTIKIDCSFTRRMLQVERDHIIMRNLIRMARDLGMQTVCEGVETPAQLEAIREMDADYWQGYLYSPAVSEPALREMLADGGVPAAPARQPLS